MKRHLNTLFVTTDGAYLKKEGQAVVVRIDKKTALRLPLHNLDGICCLARVSISPPLMAAAAQAGVSISLMTEHGRLLARIVGFTSGNVLLRREQYRRSDDPAASLTIAKHCILGKIANARTVLRRAVRDAASHEQERKQALANTADRLTTDLDDVQRAADLDQLRGIEGNAANTYFSVFNHLLTQSSPDGPIRFNGRTRRPPRDPVNALLSFLYQLLAHDARSACESVGLDPAVGFLHRDRPGRPSLALDLIEELRPLLADRLALSLINRKQVTPADFHTDEAGGVRLSDTARKTLLTNYQTRKQEVINHPFLNEKTSIGLIVHLQARLLARHIRGDLDQYPPFLWK